MRDYNLMLLATPPAYSHSHMQYAYQIDVQRCPAKLSWTFFLRLNRRLGIVAASDNMATGNLYIDHHKTAAIIQLYR